MKHKNQIANQNISFLYVLFLVAFAMFSCGDDDTLIDLPSEPSPGNLIITSTLNPSGYAPLSATMSVSSDVDVTLEITVKGKHGSRSDYSFSKSNLASIHLVDVHGLYADHENQIEVVATDASGNVVSTGITTITTDELIADLPEIEVQNENLDENYPVFYLVNYFGFAVNSLPHRPFLVDQFGDIRWYLDFSSHNILNEIYLDNGVFHMQNNNLVFSGAGWDQVFITDLFGNIQNSFSMGDYTFHHTIIEKEDGNLLFTANQKNRPTVQDVIIEMNALNGNIVNIWDLTESLDPTRTTWTFDSNDWIHVNGVTHDPSDNTIIITGRTQGVFKLNYDNEIQWILAPHKDWSISGDGIDMNDFLLQPLDQNGEAITDQDVIEGNSNADDFEWNWYQHSPILLPNGNFMCFDNGDNRNFGSSPSYSRAVEYKIDQENMTVQQIWDYGKELGTEAYSRIVSKVNYIPDLNHVMFTPGAITTNGPPHGRIYEVDKSTKEEKLDIKITPPQPLFAITFHNAQRFDLGRGN